jgi:3-phenylpropionate/cinnamic acid dioxygenase small subunit
MPSAGATCQPTRRSRWPLMAEDVPVSDETARAVERFLYREARLLDERRFDEWLTLLADDIHYWVATRSNRYPKRSKAIAILDPDRYVEDDMPRAGDLAILDETRATLAMRVERLDTGMAWAEDPPSRTRHLVSNIEVFEGDKPAELTALSNFIVYRTRAETEQDFYVGTRRDTLRPIDGGFQLAGRKVVLDQNVLLAKNVSVFF